ncbi:hypothetical protein, partial [Burkholderia thailandensis]
GRRVRGACHVERLAAERRALNARSRSPLLAASPRFVAAVPHPPAAADPRVIVLCAPPDPRPDASPRRHSLRPNHR